MVRVPAPRSLLSRGRGLLSRTPPPGAATGRDDTVVGLVEEFSRRRIVGWLSVPAGTAPVKVEVWVDDYRVTSTHATPNPSMSGADSPLRAGEQPAQAGGPAPSAPAMIPGPPDDRRNSDDEIRVFAFRIRGIWPYVRRANKISVRVGGRPLPVVRHGLFLRPRRRGAHSLDELRRMFERGYLLDQMGRISLSRTIDAEWQASVMRLHRRVGRVLSDDFGLTSFLIYGTLLGAVREGGPISHDADFDAAYLSGHTDGAAAAAELHDVALALVRDGLEVDCHATALHIFDPELPDHRIDLFHCYFDDGGEIAFPFGAAGTSSFTRHDWAGFEPTEFLGEKTMVPVAAEKLVAHLYGDDWRVPKAGFNWDVDRTRWAPEGHLSVEQRTRVHWASFYSHHQQESGSSFSRFAMDRPDLPGHLVDLGCGDGRDACTFGGAGLGVLGLDASPQGVERAAERADRLGLTDRARFGVCDVSDTAALSGHLTGFRDATAGPVAYYLRFFLHAIPEDVQHGLLSTLADVARPGDLLLAEFRTTADEGSRKAHGKHYRRFIDAADLREQLPPRYGFEVDYFTEGQGLSPYGEEDPVLCRIVGVRSAPPTGG